MVVVSVKIKEKGEKNLRYNNRIDFTNPQLLALLFSDLELYGAKIEKAYEIYKKNKGKETGFPF